MSLQILTLKLDCITAGDYRTWRPDREPRSCTYAQLEEPVSFNLAEILQGRP